MITLIFLGNASDATHDLHRIPSPPPVYPVDMNFDIALMYRQWRERGDDATPFYVDGDRAEWFSRNSLLFILPHKFHPDINRVTFCGGIICIFTPNPVRNAATRCPTILWKPSGPSTHEQGESSNAAGA